MSTPDQAVWNEFDLALRDNLLVDGDAWANDGFFVLSAIATRLAERDLVSVHRMWSARPRLWQQHCAEVLGSNRLDDAIEILLNMVDEGLPKVSLAALESLREFDLRRFSTAQNARILVALEARLGQPMELLHRVVLEAFAATLHLDKAQ